MNQFIKENLTDKKRGEYVPKIIEDLHDRILAQAEKELFEKGYSSMTMRGVAEGCGIAVGTVYNYYKSKDVLVAQIMLRDWVRIMNTVKLHCESSISIHEAFHEMYNGVVEFSDTYGSVWRQYGKDISVRREMPMQFDWLIKQLSDILKEVLVRCHNEEDEYMPVFLSEILLNTATKKDFEYENIARLLYRIFP